ncbi:MAG TPA: ABC transporter ATP-binding protein [Desulfobacterales bacterium]|nr:ABC transporter ATP-binding protein [Desulfobacterales bacterium]
MIRVEGLYKQFESQDVLKGVSFHVPRGEFLALIGMSGSGKSVLLKHIAGIFRPDRGRVLVDGQEIAKLRGRALERLRRRFGFVFQNGALFDSLTVFENVAFPLQETTKLPKEQIADRVMHELEQVGLRGSEHKYPAEISGGMIKRTALARALVMDPEIMFFDEPTTGLDPVIARSILELFDSCHQRLGITGIIVSHDIPEIFNIVQKVAFVYEGKILALGTPQDIQESEDPVVRQFISGSTAGPIQYK